MRSTARRRRRPRRRRRRRPHRGGSVGALSIERAAAATPRLSASLGAAAALDATLAPLPPIGASLEWGGGGGGGAAEPPDRAAGRPCGAAPPASRRRPSCAPTARRAAARQRLLRTALGGEGGAAARRLSLRFDGGAADSSCYLSEVLGALPPIPLPVEVPHLLAPAATGGGGGGGGWSPINKSSFVLSDAALTFEGVNDTTTAADAAAGNGSVVVGAGLLATLGGTVALRGALPSFGLDLVEGAADPIAAATFEKAPLRPALSAGGLMNLTTAAARLGGAAAKLARAEDEPSLRALLDGVALRPACAGAGCAGLAQLSLPLEWFVPLAFPPPHPPSPSPPSPPRRGC